MNVWGHLADWKDGAVQYLKLAISTRLLGIYLIKTMLTFMGIRGVNQLAEGITEEPGQTLKYQDRLLQCP